MAKKEKLHITIIQTINGERYLVYGLGIKKEYANLADAKNFIKQTQKQNKTIKNDFEDWSR